MDSSTGHVFISSRQVTLNSETFRCDGLALRTQRLWQQYELPESHVLCIGLGGNINKKQIIRP